MARLRLRLLAGLLTLIAALLIEPVAAHAQSDGGIRVSERFQDFLNTEGYMGLLLMSALKNDKKLPPPCTDIEPLDRALIAVLQPISFAEENGGNPSSGIWIERVGLRRCGKTVYRNIVFFAKPGERLMAMGALPGETLADLRLQSDTKAALLAFAKKGNPSCETTTIVDTEVLKLPPPSGGPWVKRWSVYDCIGIAAHDVTFTPNAQGRTTYSFNLKPN